MHKLVNLLLRRAFDIREGETRKTLLMQATIFLFISTLLIVKPTIYGLFIAEIGVEKLPEAFILVAIFAAILSTVYSKLLRRYSFHTVFHHTLKLSILSLIAFGILLRLNFHEGWVLYLIYIWVALFAVLSASQFWILANLVFNVREAKRLFGFIGAGAIAGGIFGGYLTSLIAPFIGSKNLLFVSTFMLILIIPLTRIIWKENVEGQQNTFQQKKRLKGSTENPARMILNSRHLSYLAVIVGLSVIVAKLVDYQFGAVASDYIDDADELTAFFGFWYSNMNLLSLCFQLFLTRRVVGTLGVGSSLFFLPGGILIGAVILLLFPFLWAAIILKLADGSLKQSINKASVELLMLPVPSEIKSQTKTFIDVFVDSAATGISGLILIFLVGGLDLSARFISLMVIALIVLWVFIGLKIRREYIRTFRLKVESEKEESSGQPPDLSIPSVLGGLKKVLKEGNEKQKLYILNIALELKDERLFDAIAELLVDPSSAIKTLAIRNLYFLRSRDLRTQIEPLIEDADPEVRIEAFKYLLEHAREERIPVMRRYLDSDSLLVRSSAILSLARETRDNQVLKKLFHLEEKIRDLLKIIPKEEAGELRTAVEINAIRAIGQARIPQLYSDLEDQLSSHDPNIKKIAIEAAGHTLSVRFIPRLSKLMADEKFSGPAIKALANYGEAIIPHYRQQIVRQPLLVEVWRKLPSLLQEIPGPLATDFLFHLMDFEDSLVRMEALKALNKLKAAHPYLRFREKEILSRIHTEANVYRNTLAALYSQEKKMEKTETTAESDERYTRISAARASLIGLLERRLDINVERIFRLLGLKYPPDEMRNIYKSIQSDAEQVRENALEFLDNLLEANLKKVLIPIVETATLDTITEETIRNLRLQIPDDYTCYKTLLEVRDLRVKLAVLYVLQQLGDEMYIPLAEPYLLSENKKLRDFAGKVMDSTIGDKK